MLKSSAKHSHSAMLIVVTAMVSPLERGVVSEGVDGSIHQSFNGGPSSHSRDELHAARDLGGGLPKCSLPTFNTHLLTFHTSSRGPLYRIDYMASTFSQYLPDARRIRSFFTRLPLATRGLLAIITALYIAHWFFPRITEWGALIPQEINFGTRRRRMLRRGERSYEGLMFPQSTA